jgi:hypothetical protein
VVLPFISDDEAERMFAHQGGIRKVRSFLRYVRDPSLRSLVRRRNWLRNMRSTTFKRSSTETTQ